ncbi:uncharacterized protein LOC131318885 [Rhododendron vialii]|uniref:uncharacterized protein LOC131318885 n=1 Tax=Rhododendron vialii TaxID=182163 RepID=UPI00265FF654|nr:uncharacterized protein LOC131318885 [Rhododendron vialii]
MKLEELLLGGQSPFQLTSFFQLCSDQDLFRNFYNEEKEDRKLGPLKGLEEKELLVLVANKETWTKMIREFKQTDIDTEMTPLGSSTTWRCHMPLKEIEAIQVNQRPRK